MFWAIVALAVLNLTTILTIIYSRSQNGQVNAVPETGIIQSENASARFSGRYFRDQLGLNNEQMSRFKEFNPGFRQHVRDININLVHLRQQMLEEMSAPDSDTSKLDLLSDSVGYLHADLKKLTYRYYLDFKKICNKQQKEKLDQLFGEMFATDIHTGQYGPGGPYGRGRGRRFNN